MIFMLRFNNRAYEVHILLGLMLTLINILVVFAPLFFSRKINFFY